MKITLANYRCFPNGASFDISHCFTALVGANNSGKSTLLRFVYEFRPLLNLLATADGGLVTILVNALRGVPQRLSNQQVQDTTELFSKSSNGNMIISFDISPLDNDSVDRLFRYTVTRLEIEIDRASLMWTAKLFASGSLLSASYEFNKQIVNGKHIISTRGNDKYADMSHLVNSLSILGKSMYIGSFRNAINSGGAGHFDIDVGHGFIERLREWSTGTSVPARDAALEFQRLIKQLFCYDEFMISTNANASALLCTIDGRSYSLSEQGSGLAQFIMVLANIAIKRPSCVFIDEPELNLHPSLQRDFLTAMALYTNKVVFATHSLGLALCDADRIFSVVRRAQGISEVHEYGLTPRLSEFLGELSYAGHRERGFDSILLVEGPTDVKAFRQFLQVYGKHQKVVLVQLGGSSMVNGKRAEELAEVTHICGKIRAVVDSDRTSAGGAAKSEALAFQAVCAKHNIQCFVTERFATENYLTDAAVKRELGPLKAALGHYEKIDKRTHWDKDMNWKIARHMTKADLDSTDLGPFLANL